MRTEQMRIDPAYRERLRACGLDTVDRVLARVDGRIAAWSRTTDTLFVPGHGGEPGFYVKRHFFPTWRSRLRGMLRGTFFRMHRGQAEYLALRGLLAAGVPTVRPVAYGSRRRLHFVQACFLITEEVPEARNLTTFAQDVAAGRRALAPGARHTLVRALAAELGRMHGCGLSHGNLFWRNVLVRAGPDGQPEFFFLDVKPLELWTRMCGTPWWVRELAQTLVSALPFTTRTDRLRFYRQYFGGERLTPPRRAYLAAITRCAAQWQRHEERRIRMNRLFDEWNRQLADEEARAAASGGAGA